MTPKQAAAPDSTRRAGEGDSRIYLWDARSRQISGLACRSPRIPIWRNIRIPRIAGCDFGSGSWIRASRRYDQDTDTSVASNQ